MATLTAKITNRRPNPTGQHANGSHVCDVTCPKCEHTLTVTYGGWTGLVCGGCRATLRRTQKTLIPSWGRFENGREIRPTRREFTRSDLADDGFECIIGQR